MDVIEVVETVNRYGAEYIQKLVADDRTPYNWFGTAVAMSVDKSILVVGSQLDDDDCFETGSVYLFKRDAGSNTFDPTHIQKLNASDCFAGDYFGSSVTLSADKSMLVVGSRGAGERGHNAGAVYIYQRNDGLDTYSPIHTQKLMASDGTHWLYFGSSVTLSDDKTTLAVGAPGGDLRSHNSGSVYIYQRNDGLDTYSPIHTQKLTAGNTEHSGRFGVSLALSGDGTTLVVGATWGVDVGSVYIFQYDAELNTYNPDPVQRIKANDRVGGTDFGVSLALSGDGATLVVGAARGVYYVGAVYIFQYDAELNTYNPDHIQKLVSSESYTKDWFGSALHLADDGTLVVGAYGDDEDGADIGSVYIYQPLPIVEDN